MKGGVLLLKYNIFIAINYIFNITMFIVLLRFFFVGFKVKKPWKSLLLIVIGIVSMLFLADSFFKAIYTVSYYQMYQKIYYSIGEVLKPDLIAIALWGVMFLITKIIDREISKEVEMNKRDERHIRWGNFIEKR